MEMSMQAKPRQRNSTAAQAAARGPLPALARERSPGTTWQQAIAPTIGDVVPINLHEKLRVKTPSP
jgi:hypothetical protein